MTGEATPTADPPSMVEEEEEEEEVALEEDFPIVADLSTIEEELERLANRSRKGEAAMGVATQLMVMAWVRWELGGAGGVVLATLATQITITATATMVECSATGWEEVGEMG